MTYDVVIDFTTYYTCISGRIPFPKIAAMIEMDVKALKTLPESEGSSEYSRLGACLDKPAKPKQSYY